MAAILLLSLLEFQKFNIDWCCFYAEYILTCTTPAWPRILLVQDLLIGNPLLGKYQVGLMVRQLVVHSRMKSDLEIKAGRVSEYLPGIQLFDPLQHHLAICLCGARVQLLAGKMKQLLTFS